MDVRFPHRHAVRPAVDLGSTSTEEHVLEQMELNTGTGQTYIALAAIRIALARKGLSVELCDAPSAADEHAPQVGFGGALRSGDRGF